MDEKSLTDLLANLIPGEDEDTTGQAPEELKDGQKNLLLEVLTALAGQSGGPLQAAVGQFLNGQGELHERARSASTKQSAITNVEEFLTTKLNVSPILAGLIAPLVVNLVPALGGATSKEKPRRRKTKPKSEASSAKKPKKPSSAKPAAKPKPSSSSKPKPATTAKPKPKPSSAKPKKKPSSSSAKTGKKDSKPAAKPK